MMMVVVFGAREAARRQRPSDSHAAKERHGRRDDHHGV